MWKQLTKSCNQLDGKNDDPNFRICQSRWLGMSIWSRRLSIKTGTLLRCTNQIVDRNSKVKHCICFRLLLCTRLWTMLVSDISGSMVKFIALFPPFLNGVMSFAYALHVSPRRFARDHLCIFIRLSCNFHLLDLAKSVRCTCHTIILLHQTQQNGQT